MGVMRQWHDPLIKRRDGYFYVIKVSNGFIKIGYSSQPYQRMRTLIRSSVSRRVNNIPDNQLVPVHCLHSVWMRRALDAEQAARDHLADYRISHTRDWYDLPLNELRGLLFALDIMWLTNPQQSFSSTGLRLFHTYKPKVTQSILQNRGLSYSQQELELMAIATKYANPLYDWF